MVTKYFVKAANGHTADLMRFVPHFQQLAVSWTACAPMSEGTERFVDEYLPQIRKNNPQVEFKLLRTYTNCDPFVVGTYAHRRYRKFRCSWRTAEQILSNVEQMSVGGDFREGKRRGVKMALPRGAQIWDTETIGHDVFAVYSRHKGDARTLDIPRSIEHPELIIRHQLKKH